MDASKRFSDRVDDYANYRPSYPEALLDRLITVARLRGDDAVADLGSGTGIFAALLLKRGLTVYGVEPNRGMREAAEKSLRGFDRFVSINGSAEATGLPDCSVSAVTAAQAFHWFDAEKARGEISRILKRGGTAALIWNERMTSATPFLADYDALLRAHGTDYDTVNHTHVGAAKLRAFYGTNGYESFVFGNEQRFDWDGLYGRAMSSSYVPARENAGHGAFVAALRRVFDEHAKEGCVTFKYGTRMYTGTLD